MTMTRRIDLLPTRYVERRQERRNAGLIGAVALILVGLLLLWWFLLTTQISSERDKLEATRAENAAIERQIAELAPFAQLEADIQARRTALATVMAGDINWPSLLTEIAMVVPGEVWLDTLTASAGTTEGSSPVATETAEIRISNKTPTGRITFTGKALTMPGVAKWLIRQATAKAFTAVWLNSATEDENLGVFGFDSSLELGDEALSERFIRRLP